MKTRKSLTLALMIGSPLTLTLATILVPKIAAIVFGLLFFATIPSGVVLLAAALLIFGGALLLTGQQDFGLLLFA